MKAKVRRFFGFIRRNILLFIFVPLFIWFLVPVFFGIINTGNVFGMLVSTVVVTTRLMYRKMRGYKAFRISINVSAALFCLCLIYAAVLSVNMLVVSGKTPPYDSDNAAVIVLGAKTNGDEPDAMLKNRLDKALSFLLEHKDTICVVAGGLNYKNDYSEAYVMQKYLTEHGVDSSRIIMEDESRDTFENITFSAKHINENIKAYKIDKMIIVSDGFHLWRAVMTADEQGFETYTLACDTSLAVLPTYWVRELFALTRDLLLDLFN